MVISSYPKSSRLFQESFIWNFQATLLCSTGRTGHTGVGSSEWVTWATMFSLSRFVTVRLRARNHHCAVPILINYFSTCPTCLVSCSYSLLNIFMSHTASLCRAAITCYLYNWSCCCRWTPDLRVPQHTIMSPAAQNKCTSLYQPYILSHFWWTVM